MSYTNFPKNSAKDAGVQTSRKANYYILSSATKPVPTSAELASAEELLLVETDTGNRYWWTGDYWQQSHYKGSQNVHNACVHNRIINQYFHSHSATSTTLATDTVVGATSISVVSAAGFTVGASINLYASISDPHYEAEITAVVGTTITLDRPLDLAFLAGTIVNVTVTDMATVGTLASPVSYKLVPPAGEVWHITRILLAIVHGTAGDLGKFGDLAPLTNGVVLRAYVGGVFGTFTNWKSAADFKTDMYEVQFDARSGGGGSYGTSALGDFKALDVAIALSGEAGDYIEVLIQDDISALESFRIKGQGHPEGA